PTDRYATCDAMLAGARAALEGTGAPRRKRAGRSLVLVAAASLLVAGATIGGILAFRRQSADAAPAITQTAIAGAPLGLRVEGYIRIFGTPDLRVDQPKEVPGFPSTNYPTLVFLRPKVAVYFPDGWSTQAKIITTWNADLKTATGIGPCSTIKDLKAAYGYDVR